MSDWGNDPLVAHGGGGWGNDPLQGGPPPAPPKPPAANDRGYLTGFGARVGEGFSQPWGALTEDWKAAFKPDSAQSKAHAGKLVDTPRLEAADRINSDVLRVAGSPFTALARGFGNLDQPDAEVATSILGSVLGPETALAKGRGVAKVAGEVPRGAAPPPPPVSMADIKVGKALHKAIAREGTTPAEVIDTLHAHPNRPAFHAARESMTPYAKAVARAAGPGRKIIKDAVRAHQAAQHGQITGDIGEALGGRNDYLASLDKALETRRQAANAGMAPIADHPVLLDENSVRALRSDLALPAIKKAALRALADPDPAVAEAGANLNRLHDQLLDNPGAARIRVRDAQDVSKSLLDAADSAYRAGQGGDGRTLKNLGRTIRSNAGDPERGGIREYGDWLKQYGHDSENKEALELGRGAATPGVNNTAESIARRLSKMSSEASKDYYRKGLGEALIYQVRSARGGIGTMRDLLKSEDFRDKVHIAFPSPEAYDKFMDAAEERVAEQSANGRVLGGSDTAENLDAMRDLEGQGMSNAEKAKMVGETIRSPLKSAAAFGAKKLIELIPESEQGLLADPETNALLARALKDPAEMERLLKGVDPAALKKQPIANPPSQWGRKTVLDQVTKP